MPLHQSVHDSLAKMNGEVSKDELKGVQGGDLKSLVEQNTEQLWTSDGLRVVDKFLGSSVRHF